MAGRGAFQKKTQNILNIRARHDLLINGIRAPSSVENAVHIHLIGQRAFASLDLPKLNISPIALNTIKSLSDEIFTELDDKGRKGFLYLNALRVQLNASLANVKFARTAKAKTERDTNKTNHLMARLSGVELQSVKRQKAYLSLYAAVNGLIKEGKLPPEAQMRLYRILDNHHAAFAGLFEPNNDEVSEIDPKVANFLRELNKSK